MGKAYLGGLGRTPAVEVLAVTPDGKHALIQEYNLGNPLELGEDRGSAPYWMDEQCLFKSCSIHKGGGKFTLYGKPDYSGVPIQEM